MKFVVVATLLMAIVRVGPVHAQSIALDIRDMPVESALERLNRQYGFHFVYVASALDGLPPVTVAIRARDIQGALDVLLRGLPLSYSIRDKVVTLTRAGSAAQSAKQAAALEVHGAVFDAQTQQPIPSASVIGTRASAGTLTAETGLFSLALAPATDSLRFSAVGYLPHAEAVVGTGPYRVALTPVVKDIGEVVVTGIVYRKRESYTSATTAISGTELRELTNTNVVTALQAIDPAFVVIANNLRGADPALLPQIELRGKTSLSGLTLESELGIDPNLPLFILDGFESSVEQVMNLDINRIESITLLKDAASSSLYGARSANGVVVVETQRPGPGKLAITYRSDVGLEVADISDYNMMNSLEKVEFEGLAGRFELVANESSPQNPALLSRVYNERRKKALQGYSYDWLRVPLQNGVSINHSLYAKGGSDRWQLAAGGNRRGRTGVMKGSERETWGAWADVAFQKGKWHIVGKTFVNADRVGDAPANDFSRYVKQSPLYSPADTARFLDEIPYPDRAGSYREPNYTYDAQLPSAFHRRLGGVQQNVAVRWDPLPRWQFLARGQWGYQRSTETEFWSPKDSRFEDTPIGQKGTYTLRRRQDAHYQGSVMATWLPHLPERHALTVNIRTELQQRDVNNRGYSLAGFPAHAGGDPTEAFDGAPGKPTMQPSPPTIRRVNGLVSGNYVLDRRYFIDATMRVDGSTQFGSANRYALFWSAGLGWNVHDEAVLRDVDWLDVWRVRLNTGLTGNQSFGSFLSTVVYASVPGRSGGGIIHTTLGNPNLEWQLTQQTNLGVDVELWKGRVAVNANWYLKDTDPLIGVIDLPLSTGVSDYAMNVGRLKSRGMDAFLRISPVLDRSRSRVWSIGATFFRHRSRYADLAPELIALNEELRANRSLQQYVNGTGPDDLWAVKSRGIDPSNGREVFLTSDGVSTYDYDLGNTVIVGNSRPWAYGVINTVLQLRRFTFGAYFRYTLGAALLNEALYEKVENITFDDLSANQDRRALYDRWQQFGDQARFRGISLLDQTPISSRFIQRENLFSGEILSVGYAVSEVDSGLLRKLRVRRLEAIGYAHGFMRLSNVLAERGIQYPFSRTFSMSLAITL